MKSNLSLLSLSGSLGTAIKGKILFAPRTESQKTNRFESIECERYASIVRFLFYLERVGVFQWTR